MNLKKGTVLIGDYYGSTEFAHIVSAPGGVYKINLGETLEADTLSSDHCKFRVVNEKEFEAYKALELSTSIDDLEGVISHKLFELKQLIPTLDVEQESTMKSLTAALNNIESLSNEMDNIYDILYDYKELLNSHR